MAETTVAISERRELCALLDQVGPDAPTLCEGWTARDLAAHLVLRERRLDAAAGILLAPLARYTARVQSSLAQRPWPELVDLVRHGPVWWSPLRLPGLRDKINAMEFFVHHEDVRRAVTGWKPRPVDLRRAGVLWGLLRRGGPDTLPELASRRRVTHSGRVRVRRPARRTFDRRGRFA